MASDWYVVDTNVIAVANLEAGHVGEECVRSCTDFLRALQDSDSAIVVIDDGGEILLEYLRHRAETQPRVGERFIRWLLQVRADDRHVHTVQLTPTSSDEGRASYAEFPDSDELANFDEDDRKFAAAAAATGGKAVVVNATDQDWADYAAVFATVGIRVVCLCPEEVAC
jgi:hypothetical protein